MSFFDSYVNNERSLSDKRRELQRHQQALAAVQEILHGSISSETIERYVGETESVERLQNQVDELEQQKLTYRDKILEFFQNHARVSEVLVTLPNRAIMSVSVHDGQVQVHNWH
jgi:hypothetical protein